MVQGNRNVYCHFPRGTLFAHKWLHKLSATKEPVCKPTHHHIFPLSLIFGIFFFLIMIVFEIMVILILLTILIVIKNKG